MEEFIVGWAQEFPLRDPVSLVVHVNQLPAHANAQELVETAVHNYFSHRAKLNRLEFRHLLKEGRTSLIIGLAFLGASLFISQLLLRQQRATLSISSRKSHHCRLGGDVAADKNFPFKRLMAYSVTRWLGLPPKSLPKITALHRNNQQIALLRLHIDDRRLLCHCTEPKLKLMRSNAITSGIGNA